MFCLPNLEIRRQFASDEDKALALGARAVMVGRLTLWGIAAMARGAVHALALLRQELLGKMALTGCPSLLALDASADSEVAHSVVAH